VNLGTDKTRIALYQNSNPEVIAKKFAQTHGLDQTITTNLTNLLKEQLASALTNIDEEEESDSHSAEKQ
jgi:hypothetical protein